MAPSARSTHYHAGRGLARPFARRSLLGRDSSAPSQSPAAASASPSPSQTGPTGVTLPPHGVAALIGIIVMLTLFILGFAAWRVWVWRNKKVAAAVATLEKSSKPIGVFDAVDEDYDIKRPLSLSSSKAVRLVLPMGPQVAMTRERYPHEFKANLGYQPKVVYSASQADQKLPPSILVTPAPVSLHITPPPTYADVPAPALSPRTASKSPNANPVPSTKLPRLVVVESTFTTTLHDELEIREGETLRLLEEYEDEWCLVQRVGPKDAEKGVVPRFCVVERPDSAPSQKSSRISRRSSSVTKP